MALLALDLFARIIAARIDAAPPFSALFTLWLSMTQAVGLASRSMSSRHSRRARDECDPACRPSSKVEITKQRALRRQVFGNITPLASRAQHIHEAVHDFPRSTERLRPPRLAGGSRARRATTHRSSDRWITQLVTIVFRAVFGRPHRRPLLESGHLP